MTIMYKSPKNSEIRGMSHYILWQPFIIPEEYSVSIFKVEDGWMDKTHCTM
jgi:hypothetical protein